MANSRRHHFAAKFYQKNFAEPIFSKHIRVYEADTKKWNSEPITHGNRTSITRLVSGLHRPC